MKFIVTVYRTERVSFDELKDVGYSKVFDANNTVTEILDWANKVLAKSYKTPVKAKLSYLKFSEFIDELER